MRSEFDPSNPARSRRVISFPETSERDPNFFKKRAEMTGEGWRLNVENPDGSITSYPFGTPWEIVSNYGSIRSVTITDPEGRPYYDAPKEDRRPGVNAIPWGRDKKTGEIKIGVITQARHQADNVFEDNDESMKFEQIPAGFRDEIADENNEEKLETAIEAGKRELKEEFGITEDAILGITQPEFPNEYPVPSVMGSNSELIFIEVDLEAKRELVSGHEDISRTEFITISQLLKDIEKGKTERGYSRMSTANSSFLIFLSQLSTIQNAERNERLLKEEGETNRKLKKEFPTRYLELCLLRSEVKHPDRIEENKAKVRKYYAERFGHHPKYPRRNR